MTDADYMRMAIEKANQGVAAGQTPFGATIVRDGQILAVAHNVVWLTTDITAHAEVNAIRIACRTAQAIDLAGSVIYSTCEPCPMCFSAIHWANIAKIVYGTSIADAESCGFNELSISNFDMKRLGGSKVEVVANFLHEESMAVFNAFKAKKDRKVY